MFENTNITAIAVVITAAPLNWVSYENTLI